MTATLLFFFFFFFLKTWNGSLKKLKGYFCGRFSIYSIVLDKNKHGTSQINFDFLLQWYHQCPYVIVFSDLNLFWTWMLVLSDTPVTPSGFCMYLLYFPRAVLTLSVG